MQEREREREHDYDHDEHNQSQRLEANVVGKSESRGLTPVQYLESVSVTVSVHAAHRFIMHKHRHSVKAWAAWADVGAYPGSYERHELYSMRYHNGKMPTEGQERKGKGMSA